MLGHLSKAAACALAACLLACSPATSSPGTTPGDPRLGSDSAGGGGDSVVGGDHEQLGDAAHGDSVSSGDLDRGDSVTAADGMGGADGAGGGDSALPGDSAGGGDDRWHMAPFPDTGAFVGAFINQATSTPAEVATQLGRPLAVELNYFGWDVDILTTKQSWITGAIQRGAIPEVSWQLDGTADCSGVHFDDILAGTQDSVIIAAAQALKSLAPHWVLLRPWWEMNGGWYCTNQKYQRTTGQCDGTTKYVNAWRYVHAIFDAQGVTNVRWLWSTSRQVINDPTCPNSWQDYYPGDAYVDAVAPDGYNKAREGMLWESFADIFTPMYEAFPQKLFLVGETASGEDANLAGHKAQWIADARAYIKSSMPRFKLFLWFIKGPVNGDPDDYRLDTSPEALQAIHDLATDPYFDP